MNSSEPSPPIFLTLYSSLSVCSVALGVCVCVVYISGVCLNLLLLVVVWAEPRLHRPMYVLLVNLCMCGLTGLSAVCPLMVAHLLGHTRSVPLALCLTQVFLINVYVGSIFSILALMAFDRYVSICKPLLYHAIMTPQRVRLLLLTLYAFLAAASAGQVSLASGVRLCGHVMDKLVCDSVGINNLSCQRTALVSTFGLCCALCLVMAPCCLVVLSYGHIFSVVLGNSKNSQARALQTCLPHLLTFVNFSVASLFGFISNRLSQTVPRTVNVFVCLNFFVVPPLIHPIIYGIKMREIQQGVKKVILNKIINVRF